MAKEFLVRVNCEYSVLVPASSPEDAVDKANNILLSEWSQAWSCVEAEEE